MANESYTLLILDGAARETAKKAAEQGMGKPSYVGFSADQLRKLHKDIQGSRIHELKPLCDDPDAEDACVLVIKLPEDVADGAFSEMRESVHYSEYAHRYGRKVRSLSRNVGFLGEESSPEDPDSNAPATTAWAALPSCARVREFLHATLKDAEAAHAVAIKYRDVRSCGIRWHGDAERSKTLICRFGPNSNRHPLFLMWYKDNVPISEPFAVHLDHGEVAIPSFKAVGSDFKTRKIPTLRHATGFVGTDGPMPKISRTAQKRMRGE